MFSAPAPRDPHFPPTRRLTRKHSVMSLATEAINATKAAEAVRVKEEMETKAKQRQQDLMKAEELETKAKQRQDLLKVKEEMETKAKQRQDLVKEEAKAKQQEGISKDKVQEPEEKNG